MNIFAIENNKEGGIDWIRSARSLDNLRVVKMILESCQILSTVLNEQGLQAPYKSFNPKHPSCLWAAESSANFRALITHCDAMLKEYTERFSKTHKCDAVLDQIVNLYDRDNFNCHYLTPLRMAMPDCFKHDDVVESYRKYYANKDNMRYPSNKVPDWFVKYRGDKEYQIIA
jgi:hypothetical protein|tara:strand:+ start:757 stop:1272 length:516 start_codon:yes stop_codon:yes gene_type:complete